MPDIEHELKKFLNEEELMNIASSSENKPWSATVFFTIDNFMNLCFISKSNSRHCKEIGKNEFVSGTIYSKIKDFGPVKGIQFEGRAKKSDDSENI
ncbi:MAG: pyridoxamine 5'-phosphate oxidase family protein, partial [Candidatus Diapherotrites archaeon]|nr:pyridoxamine 5'-phosphate oxidase family protein [Candidatus Diapherotrites archaeon]